jgi:hypothetical protein
MSRAECRIDQIKISQFTKDLLVDCAGGDTTISPDGKGVYFTLDWESPDLFNYVPSKTNYVRAI